MLDGGDGREHVGIASRVQDRDAHVAWASNVPPGGRHAQIESDGRPIGYIEIIDAAREDLHYWGDVPPGIYAIDIWIGESSELNKGYGTQMMQLAIDRCFADPAVHTILIDPLRDNLRARRFYERLGFAFVENRRFGADDCAVYQLTRNSWKR